MTKGRGYLGVNIGDANTWATSVEMLSKIANLGITMEALEMFEYALEFALFCIRTLQKFRSLVKHIEMTRKLAPYPYPLTPYDFEICQEIRQVIAYRTSVCLICNCTT